MAKKLVKFRTSLAAMSFQIVNQAAEIVETETREHFVHGADTSAGELRKAEFPLSASGFNPGAAGLRKEWDILIQSGHLRAAYGKDFPHYDVGRRRWRVNVGFDDSAPGSPRGVSFGDPSSTYRAQTVDMHQLLSWILDGTSRMVGRPILVNGFAMAYPKLLSMLGNHGLKLIKSGGLPQLHPVSRGPRGHAIKPTR